MRLNIGSGGQHLDGWVALDRAGDVDVIHELTDPFPFEDSSCEAVLAHHVLCMIPPDSLPALLEEIRRVLEPGGWLRISDAHIGRGIAAALAGNKEWFPEPRGNLDETLGWFITQGGVRCTPLTPRRMGTHLVDAGFTFTRVDCGATEGPSWLTGLDSREGESFFMDARCA